MKTLIKYLSSISIIVLIIWGRFLHKRAPVFLEEVSITYVKIITILSLIFLFIYLLYKNLNIINGKIFSTTGFFYKIQTSATICWINEYILNSPKFLYEQIAHYYSIRQFIEKPASYITAYWNYPKYIALLMMAPRIVIATIFVVEVYYLNQMLYFFLSLSLLIPLLICNILIYLTKTFSRSYLDFLELHLNISEANKTIYITLKEQPPDDPDALTMEEMRKRFDEFSDFYYIYIQIHQFTLAIQQYENKYNPYMAVYTSICFIIGWTYYLLYVLHII